MKYCSACLKSYQDEYQVCPKDSSVLQVTSELLQGLIIRDKYEILDKIGTGGMATVYRARHILFKDVRALKVIRAALVADPMYQDLLKRIENEAVCLFQLRHPNAVEVYDFDRTEDGRPFVVMEYAHGRELRAELLEKGILEIRRVVSIGSQVASALGAAHRLGIVHRDVTPRNIIVESRPDGSDRVKVLDFGIAKLREPDAGAKAVDGTRTDVLLGTPRYMSPEQIRRKELDGRSDIYSLGVVLYETITGGPPFTDEDAWDCMLRHVHTPPEPLEARRPDLVIPRSLSTLVMQALQKDPEQRQSCPEEMVQQFEEVQREMAERLAGPADGDLRPESGTRWFNSVQGGAAPKPQPEPRAAQDTPATGTVAKPDPTTDSGARPRPDTGRIASPVPLPVEPPPAGNTRSYVLAGVAGVVLAIVIGYAVLALKTPPELKGVAWVNASPRSVVVGGTATIRCEPSGARLLPLSYEMKASAGALSGHGGTDTLNTAGVAPGTSIAVTCTVRDVERRKFTGTTDVAVTATEGPAIPSVQPPPPLQLPEPHPPAPPSGALAEASADLDAGLAAQDFGAASQKLKAALAAFQSLPDDAAARDGAARARSELARRSIAEAERKKAFGTRNGPYDVREAELQRAIDLYRDAQRWEPGDRAAEAGRRSAAAALAKVKKAEECEVAPDACEEGGGDAGAAPEN